VKLKLSRDEFFEAYERAEQIDDAAWRHGRSVRYLIHRDGKSFDVWINIHREEGIQVPDDGVTLTEVVPVDRVTTSWEPVS
jgi:hypothetical protein